jgi:hypothetical protein
MVPVLFVDNEIEAELAKGRLESEGIAAQVRFTARGGYPRYVIGYGGYGIPAPMSTYEVLVPAADENEAKAILGSRPPRAAQPWTWRRQLMMLIAIAYILPVVAALLLQALRTLGLLF